MRNGRSTALRYFLWAKIIAKIPAGSEVEITTIAMFIAPDKIEFVNRSMTIAKTGITYRM